MANDHLVPRSWSQVSPAFVVFWAESGILLLQLMMVLRCVSHLSGKSSQHWRIKYRMKLANLICHFLIILSTLMDILHAYGTLTTNSRWLVTRGWTLWVHIMADVMYYLETLAVYVVLVYRLTLTFSETLFAVRYRDLISVFSLTIIQSLLYAAYVYYLGRAENQASSLSKHKRNFIIGTVKPVLSAFITCIGWLIDGYLVSMFVVRLRNFVVDSAINYRTISTPYSRGLMFAIAKQTNLGVFLILISQFFFTVQFVLYTAGRREHFAMYLAPLYLSRAIDGLVSQCLLDLSFTYSTGLYLKLCGVCHGYISSYQQENVRKRVSMGLHKRLVDHHKSDSKRSSSNNRSSKVRKYSFSVSTVLNSNTYNSNDHNEEMVNN